MCALTVIKMRLNCIAGKTEELMFRFDNLRNSNISNIHASGVYDFFFPF